MNDQPTKENEMDETIEGRLRELIEVGSHDPSMVGGTITAFAPLLAEAADELKRLRAEHDPATVTREGLSLLSIETLRVVADGLMTRCDEVIQMLREFVDLDEVPCRLDHRGYCQEHYGGFADDGCATRRARELLGMS